MKGVLLILVIGSCAASVVGPIEVMHEVPIDFDSEERSEPQDMLEVGRMIMTAMQSLLANQQKEIDLRLKQLELYVDKTCGVSAPKQEQAIKKEDIKIEVSQMLARMSDYVSSMSQGFKDELEQQLDVKVDLAMRKMEELLGQSSTAPLAKTLNSEEESGITSISSGISDELLSAISRTIQNQMKNLVGKSDLQKQTEHLDKQLRNIEIGDSRPVDFKIMNYTKSIHNILYSFRPIYESFRKAVNNCDMKEDQLYQMDRFEQLLQELKAEVSDNCKLATNFFQTFEDASDLLDERLEAAESLTEQVANEEDEEYEPANTRTASIPKKGKLSTCEDSYFGTGVHAIDVCRTAVRHDKCSLRVVAFHCCRSCTDAGLLPEIGPHRYLNLSRNVSLLKQWEFS